MLFSRSIDNIISILEMESPSSLFGSSNAVSQRQPPTEHHLRVLRSRFNINEFKPLQWKVISSVFNYLNGQPSDTIDQCVIAPSGYGKSLCYQFVPVYTDRLALVICPLIALMQEQVCLLNESDIPATYLGSAQENSAGELGRAFKGEIRLLYVTPEYCMKIGSETIINLHKKVNICLVAIDEAQCITSWGSKFRPDFGKLSQLRKWLPDVPFLALTATAGLFMMTTIVNNLALKNPVIHSSKIDRSNIYFEVHQRSDDIKVDMKTILHNSMTASTAARYTFRGSCIVYCITKSGTETVCAALKDLGVKCDFYHAGLNMEERGQIHLRFIRNEIECIVATIAFSMVQKLDIRTIIHYGAPKYIESYMQEAGRAGRDGLPSRCIVFYSCDDIASIRRIVLKDFEWNVTLRDRRAEMMDKMENYLLSNRCRRQQMLKHFDEEYNPNENDPAALCCDNCTTKYQSKSAIGPMFTDDLPQPI